MPNQPPANCSVALLSGIYVVHILILLIVLGVIGIFLTVVASVIMQGGHGIYLAFFGPDDKE